MSNLLSFSSCYMAMSLLALSYFGHYRTVLQKAPSVNEQRFLLATGWLLLLASGWLCILADGVGYGLMVLLGLVTVCSLMIMMLISFRPAWLPVSMLLALIGGLIPLFG